MPEEYKKSEIVPIYKQNRDPLECGNFRGIKLLEHGMKMFQKILECRLRKLITVNNMQFGFSPGKRTTDAVFIIQQLQEKHLEVHKDLFLAFVDLEKAYGRVPRDLVYWCLRRRGVPEKLVTLVEATYHGIRKELGVSSIQEKVREMRLLWYRHMQRMEENNEVRAVGNMRVPGKRPRGDQEGDGWIASEGICRHWGSPRKDSGS